MIIGENRTAVIENIKEALKKSDFYAKVEINDPVLTEEESNVIIEKYLAESKKPHYKIKMHAACLAADVVTAFINKNTDIIGSEKAENISGGAIITSNHFSPVENTVVRYYVNKKLKKRLCIVSQVTNFAMKGIIGFFMNFANTVPLSGNIKYMTGIFMNVLNEHIENNEVILIYPEQEMWFNYRKPRPPKRGAYYFAAKLNVPVISCFVEIIDTDKNDTDEFKKIRYRIHILDVLKPDPDISVRENSRRLCDADYNLKKSAYERIYGKELNYEFENSDIAGWNNI